MFQSEAGTDESYVSQLFILTHKDSLQLKPRLGTQPNIQFYALATFIGAPQVGTSTYTLKSISWAIVNFTNGVLKFDRGFKIREFTYFVSQLDDKNCSSFNYLHRGLIFEINLSFCSISESM